MSQIPKQDYIDKIILLENSSHRFKRYELIEPIDFSGKLDVIEIQKVTKKISQHIGFDKLIFTISFKNFNNKDIFSSTAGNVLLDDNEDVLIHLSNSLNGYPECILATLSHEIAHKFNHINNLSFQNTYENEIFTDLTSVYLGFGKLMLNGVEVIEKDVIGNLEKTYTKTVGYLNREQLAFIYLVINTLIGIKRKEYYHNLKKDAVIKVKEIEKEHSSLIKNIKYYKYKIYKINKIRYKLAYLMKLSQNIDGQYYNEIRTYLKDTFEQLNLIENQTNKCKKAFFNNTITTPRKYRRFRNDFPKIFFDNKKFKYCLNLSKNIKTKHSQHQENLLTECLICNTKIRLKSNNIGVVKCPNCGFKFAVDTRKNEKTLIRLKNKIKSLYR